ncbi:Formylglycine-generating sulfatase enzyme [Gimesia panareensis]|uniref:Formylglycine-generating sulfatase enzyme n=1 Tax=Gimesia panareensis TaxID=2527978 RepID=A0A518FRZ4_9PLAN|nr:SUMF1/EgtB/PvdO family nonheme iron enzyme [Gimesia panareensis]QDV19104.1 Formylglycine-generating sulfatase enzyme [Gimesia panareensis]
MSIQIIYEDLVDWEPLQMRFIAGSDLTRSESEDIARLIKDWMDRAAEADPELWEMAKEWGAGVEADGTVTAACEFFPPQEIERLAEELTVNCPQIAEMRMGMPLEGPACIKDTKWFSVDAGEVTVGKQTLAVPAFEISWSPVTVGQYEEFIAATGYTPLPDKFEEQPGFLIDHFKLNFGPSPKHALYGVTHDDALAFCKWANLRLPTDHELKHFFHSACRQGQDFVDGGECWTSTSVMHNLYVSWEGPCRAESLSDPDERYRKLLDRYQYQFLEAPCFRVVKI